MNRSNQMVECSLNLASCVIFSGMLTACEPTAESSLQPQGQEKTAKTEMLEVGASLLQANSPLKSLDIYLDGFHADTEDPNHQMEAHHFCHQVNEDFAQCALFDGNTRQANLIGIEYIISEALFKSLPGAEKKYWHPHNFEILSGQLMAPGIPEMAEKELMKGKMNSYGKTWHVWNSAPFGQAGDLMPFGEPKLEWSFNRDGEALPGLVEQRDQRLKVMSAEQRRQRNELIALAKPQMGVDALKGKFPSSTSSLPGVTDIDAEPLK